jgi:putative nucleotidyltransferase with HDIG domain
MSPFPLFSLLKGNFLHYVNSLPDESDEVRDHFAIKKSHTFRVIANSKIIAVQSGFSKEETELASVIALFHDIGRFEQFLKYRTFDDTISENHAQVAVKVLQQQHLTDDFDGATREIIIRSIENHNVPCLHAIQDDNILLFSRLLRDADKLDIWNITLEQNIAYTLRYIEEPRHYHVPQIILNSIRDKQIVLLQNASSMNDFRLLRLSWIFDMNFRATFSLIEKRKFIDKILGKIPDFHEKAELADIFHEYCQNRIRRN